MKSRINRILMMVLVAASFSSVAMAECKGHQCDASDKKCGSSQKDCDKKEQGCPIAAKFCKKACFILENKDEVSLSAEQVSVIKGLDADVKKDKIRQQAEMEIFMLDIQTRLSEDPFDLAASEALVDKVTLSMANYTKNTLRAYAKLKTTVTEEQKTKLKALYAKK